MSDDGDFYLERRGLCLQVPAIAGLGQQGYCMFATPACLRIALKCELEIKNEEGKLESILLSPEIASKCSQNISVC